jgi:hypothetical protein
MLNLSSRPRLLASLAAVTVFSLFLIGYHWASESDASPFGYTSASSQPYGSVSNNENPLGDSGNSGGRPKAARNVAGDKEESSAGGEEAIRRSGLCLQIDGPANVRDQPSGTEVVSISDSSYVRLDTLVGEWRRIRYTRDQSEHACNSADTFEDVGWTHAINLPYMGVLAYDLQPTDGPLFGGKLRFGDEKNLDSLYEDGQLLPAAVWYGTKPVAGTDAYRMWESANQEIAFWWIYTGQVDVPYAVLFSGWHGDSESDGGSLTLFGNGMMREWTPWSGNRVGAWLHDVRDDALVIREGFHCTLPVRNVLVLSDSGTVQRRRGRFTVSDADRYRSFNTVDGYTRQPLPLRPHLGSRDTTFIQVDSATAWETRLPGGPDPTVRFLRVRYTSAAEANRDENRMVEVVIDGRTGWTSMEAIRTSIPALFGRACCGCG